MLIVYQFPTDRSLMRKPFDSTIGIAFLSFILLGLPDGLLGLAYPYMRREFNLSLDSIGVLLLAGTLGFTLTTFNSGPLVQRLRAGPALLLATLIRGLALCGIFLSPSWEMVIFMTFTFTAGSGLIDAALNMYVSRYNNPLLINWLHGFFGVGATIGPLLMVAIFENMGSFTFGTQTLQLALSDAANLFTLNVPWRVGYLVVGIVQLALVITYLSTINRWQLNGITQETHNDDESYTPPTSSLRLPAVWLGMIVFALYAGMEISTGQWSFTLFTESRGIDENTAGLWVSIYWASFTIGRFFFGIIGNQVAPYRLLWVTLSIMLLGTLLLWLNLIPIMGLIGVATIGFALAPTFPMLITTTVQRVAPRHIDNAIGFQVGAASLGVALFPWLAGVFAERLTLEVIGPFLLVLAACLTVAYGLLSRIRWQAQNSSLTDNSAVKKITHP